MGGSASGGGSGNNNNDCDQLQQPTWQGVYDDFLFDYTSTGDHSYDESSSEDTSEEKFAVPRPPPEGDRELSLSLQEEEEDWDEEWVSDKVGVPPARAKVVLEEGKKVGGVAPAGDYWYAVKVKEEMEDESENLHLMRMRMKIWKKETKIQEVFLTT